MNLGADDYVTKPYSPAVLIARIQSIIRRSSTGHDDLRIERKGVVLDIGAGTVAYEDGTAELTRNELKILHILMRNPGIVITRTEIMRDLWESDAFIDDNTLTVNVNRLRKTLSKLGVPDDFPHHTARTRLHGMSANISLDDIDDLPRYTPLAYLRDRWGSALIGALLIAGLCLTLPSSASVPSMRPGGGIRPPLHDRRSRHRLPPRRAAYYHDATMYVRQIGAVCQYTALVDAPSFLEGRIMHRSIERLAFVAEKENADERERRGRTVSTSSCGSTR